MGIMWGVFYVKKRFLARLGEVLLNENNYAGGKKA